MDPLSQQNLPNRWGLRVLVTLLGLFLGGATLSAQTLRVEGIVTGIEDDLPLPGVAVMIKGTSTGTVTDIDGRYGLEVDRGTTLLFTYTGMEDQEVIANRATIDVALAPASIALDEVVVIGYGSQKKKEVTGAVARVDSEDINEFLSSDLGMAIQGRIAGVNVVASSGEPGAGSNIQIRGISSITGASEPLYVVDGVPQNSDPRIPNTEIESIDVLKDAASASIYGTRAAGGVILITTKSGKAGKAKVSLDASYGVNDITSDISLMNTNETLYFFEQRKKYVPALAGTKLVQNPDWLLNDTDLRGLVQNDGAATQNYSMSISGGQNNFSYNATLGFFDQEGVMVNSNFKRINGRVTTTYREGKTSIRTSLGYSTEDNDLQGGGLLFWAISYDPFQPMLSKDTEVVEVTDGPSETQANNLLRRLKNINNLQRDRFNGSIDISRELVKGLTVRAVLGGAINNSLDEDFAPSYQVYNSTLDILEPSDPTLSFSRMRSTRSTNWTVNPSLTYKTSFGDHNLTTLASFSLTQRKNEDFTAEAQGIDDPNLSVLNNGLLAEFAYNGFNYTIRDVGLIGRILYDFKGRYLLSASVRRDASSKFGSTNRWGTFPSVSVGYNLSEEPFWENLYRTVNFVKFRASIGTTGNESFLPYSYSGVIDEDYDYIFTDGDAVTVGKAQAAFSNAEVKWETSIQSNFGLDLGFFDNKLTASIDYYYTEKKDMLFPLQLPPSAGTPFLGGFNNSVTLNVGDMINRGVEVAANYRLLAGGVNLNIGATYSRNRNKITRIFGDTQGYFNTAGTSVIGDPGAVVSKMQIGYEAGAFFLHETAGIIDTDEELAAYREIRPDAVMGDLIYVDQLTVDTDGDGIPDTADGVITTDDQVYAGSGLPDYELGFNFNAEYRGFDLSMQWYASIGNEVINGSAIFAHGEGRHRNLLNMWTPENPDATLPLLVGQNHKDHPNYKGTTDLWIEDGSFVRLRLLTLGYSVPAPALARLGISKARIYVSAQNPLTFTEYTGYDPEIGGSNIIQRGLDRGSYPVSTQYLFGVQLQF